MTRIRERLFGWALRVGETVQCRRQVRIVIRNPEFRAKQLEPLQNGFAQLALEIRIPRAAEDSAAGKTMLVNVAFTGNVEGTSARRHRFDIRAAQVGSQVHQLRRRDKQAVIELIEIATAPARFTGPRQLAVQAELPRQPVINRSDFLNDRGVYSASFHHFFLPLISFISSKL